MYLSLIFFQCDALISANLSHIVHFPSSPSYPSLVENSWTKETQRSPYCFAVPNTPTEVSQTLLALQSAGNGTGDWHIAIRSGGHGSDSQNSITDGVILDLSHLNATTYDAATKVASVGTGARWGNVYSDLQKQGVSVTGGRQSIVGVGGLILGGGVGWTTPRTGFACDNVVNFEVVLASGEVVNANASAHSDLWRALKGGSSNFGVVTRFDINTFPASNITIERRTTGPEYTDQFMAAIIDFTNLDQSFDENAMVWVISYFPGVGLTMTATEVNTVNNANTTSFDKFHDIPLISTTGKKSYTLPDAAAIDAPENVGAGAVTIANDPRVLRYCFEQHIELIASLNATVGKNFSTIIEMQPLPTYFSDISVQKGGNMLGLEQDGRNKLYFAMAVILTTPETIKLKPQVFQILSATVQKVITYAKTVQASEEFIYLPYAKAGQDPLGSYCSNNVHYMKEVSKHYDPERFFQRMVPGVFKIDRVD
ncbi:hypothetical protein COCC4DRAFT_129423 [Bipolaris maydis ATCC 48331]|uniref:FAD-binding PCMH-type domain-containing protein n=2 Tax=Cochliobolus heterostrophus TaxID=5016 RepID=M2UCW0_COCH5|nr:uncharacterized protein COCC4DRAFT_129423 [Bipolaris maydis ATCC 48331]EMD91541.1 hypothetical protein COCHEDRAFT_1101644 [Bipolaris maydis C5]KAJ5027289.1 hypothetical protein J3E73DRAFT_187399 [Bipolaris maydis]ENI08702.1 hypothetical protein COCC4DRAFT_129423 [Bipolaris maydis ATCC 48331]KAJ5058937.1 hypothetical protein J3E74DRAFT_219391 [Bipolaris maydis]KAJ6208923.1 hypothetical protein PSV09DRAFT_1101644 [Bipolaris maydis]